MVGFCNIGLLIFLFSGFIGEWNLNKCFNFHFGFSSRCEPGLIPKPDTITGCGPECVQDPDCKSGYICQNQKCIERPDPCNPSPCGPGTICMVNSIGNPICRLALQYVLSNGSLSLISLYYNWRLHNLSNWLILSINWGQSIRPAFLSGTYPDRVKSM